MPLKFIVPMLLIAIVTGCQNGGTRQSPATTLADRPSAVESSGTLTARLYVSGMSCPLCATNIDKQLLRVPGVQKVSVDLGKGLVLARLAPSNPPTRDQLAGAIAQSGFTLDRIEMPETNSRATASVKASAISPSAR